MKEAVFTMMLESELRSDFMAEADALHRPASQVMRELMRDFIAQQRERRDHAEFVRRKVETARRSAHAGEGAPHEAVEREFALRRRGGKPA